MNGRTRLYVAGFVGAVVAYVFVVLAFTGRFNFVEFAVFAVLFLVVFVGFERFIAWAETLESG